MALDLEAALPAATPTIIGTSVKRTDLTAKVTGDARYVADMSHVGLLHGKTLRSKIAHAKIKRIDTSKALALPGVKAVLTHQNVPRVLHAGSPHPRSASVTCDQYILDDRVRYWGEGIAVVAATSEDIAEEALDLIEVEYEPLPGLFTVEDAMRADAVQIHDRAPGGNLVLPPVLVERGDVERGFAEADLVIEGEYEGGRPTPAYMEPNVCACEWDGNGNLTVWISTQTAFMVRGIMAEVLGLPLHKVRVLVDHMGGGFGAKQDLFQTEFLCALLAKQTRRPVRMEYTREETFLGGRTRHPFKMWLKQGFKADGTCVAREAKIVFNSGAYGSHGPGVTIVGTNALTSLYRCENVRLEGRCVYTNSPIAGAFRGYGCVQTYYGLDIQMDEAAEKLGIDPAELKLRNAVRTGDLAPSNHPVLGHGLEDCIRRGVAEVGWAALRTRSRTGEGVVRNGWGIGCEMHGSSAYPGIKEQGNAIVKMNEDGSVVLMTGTAGLGTGAHTALAQIVAEELGVRFDDVSVMHGDTNVVPWDIGAFASHTTYMGG
ncbi:MAG: molybdopterin cofactor-binding domain-containing protein, partial [Caldimonas sp.]